MYHLDIWIKVDQLYDTCWIKVDQLDDTCWIKVDQLDDTCWIKVDQLNDTCWLKIDQLDDTCYIKVDQPDDTCWIKVDQLDDTCWMKVDQLDDTCLIKVDQPDDTCKCHQVGLSLFKCFDYFLNLTMVNKVIKYGVFLYLHTNNLDSSVSIVTRNPLFLKMSRSLDPARMYRALCQESKAAEAWSWPLTSIQCQR